MGWIRYAWIALLPIYLLTACGGDITEKKGASNRPKAIVTGPAEVQFGAKVVFDGSTSTGKDLRFLWIEDPANPPNFFLNGVVLTHPKLTITADSEGEFRFALEVKDANGARDTTVFTFKVMKANLQPVITSMTVITEKKTFDFDLAGTPPIVYIENRSPLTVLLHGTDPEGDDFWTASSEPMHGDTYLRAEKEIAGDPDPFHDVQVEVWGEDGRGGVPEKFTLDIRIAPKIDEQGLPVAVHVDCSAPAPLPGPTQGSMKNPFNSISQAYRHALNEDIQDIYVAVGICEESVEVGLDGVNLYGMFLPEEGWRRRTNPRDRSADSQANRLSRFIDGGATIIRNPGAHALMFTGEKVGHGSLKVDGFLFDVDGNRYAADFTFSTDYKLTINGNEFSGKVAPQPVAESVIGGGLRITPDPSDGTEIIAVNRNLFTLTSPDGVGPFQVSVQPTTGITCEPNNCPNLGQVQFTSNVFYGAIGTEKPYKCGIPTKAGSEPYAFCFYRESESGKPDTFTQISRNTFQLNAGQSGGVVVDTGLGNLNAPANVFYAPNQETNVRFYHINKRSFTSYNRFSDIAGVDFIETRPSTVTEQYNCLDQTKSGFGKRPLCTNQTHNTSGNGNYRHSTVLSDTFSVYPTPIDRPWHHSHESFQGIVPVNTVSGNAFPWDFWGRYSDPAATDKKVSVGAFESNAPMY